MWVTTRFQVYLAGGQALRLRTLDYDPSHLPEFDALILGGGEDVDPIFYKEAIKERTENIAAGKPPGLGAVRDAGLKTLRQLMRIIPHTGRIDHARDVMEMALLKLAILRHKPVLGLCRGAQLINVFCGGTLHQDISSYYGDTQKITTLLPRKTIGISKGSLLNRILQSDTVLANGMHSQAVNKLGDHLKAVAWEKVGIVQGIEGIDFAAPVLGVQWHPEFLFYKKDQRLLFRWLITQADPVRETRDNPALHPEIVPAPI